MMNEEWRDVVGYDDMYKGMYQVSNMGRVRSLDRIDSVGKRQHGRILKAHPNSRGYMQVYLMKNGNGNSITVHRLVATAFIDNLDNKPYINHKDEDQHNNNVNNLEWVTAKENVNYGTALERRIKSQYKKIMVIYQDNTYEYWESATTFAKEYRNGVKSSNIVNVLKGKRKTHKGLRFEYVD